MSSFLDALETKGDPERERRGRVIRCVSAHEKAAKAALVSGHDPSSLFDTGVVAVHGNFCSRMKRIQEVLGVRAVQVQVDAIAAILRRGEIVLTDRVTMR